MIASVFVPLSAALAGFAALVVIVLAIAWYTWSVTQRARLFRAVAEGSSDGLVLMHRDSKIIWNNRAYSRIMGYAHGELVGRYPLEFALPPRLAMSAEDVRAFRFDENDARFGTLTQMENMRKDRSEFIHEFSHAAIHVGGKRLFLLAGRDITERVAREKALVAAQERLKRQSMTDGLTGLSNRAHMQARLVELTGKRVPFTVLQIDVNRMKQVNDTFGHLAGDELLLQVARALRTEAGPTWLAARTGGDEFVVILPDVTSRAEAERIGHRLVEAASTPFKWKSARLTAEISVGVAMRDASVGSPDDLLNRSDVALYEAKKSPETPVVVYDDALDSKHTEKQAFERDVVEAVRAQGLTFHFQPIINIDSRTVEKFEMLVRWRHERRGWVAPGRFLPVISRLGLTQELDKFVIACAEKAIDRLNAAGLTDVGLAVNLSASALSSDRITELLTWLAECGRLDPARVSLEILESTALTLSGDDLPIRLLSRLREAGFTVFLDDFGMGYAGLAHLAALPSNGLKIDRGLTSMVDTDATSRSIVVAMVRLARELGLEIVAEGVENMAQMELVHRAGCSVFQGHAVARPMTLNRAITWARNDRSRATGTDG